MNAAMVQGAIIHAMLMHQKWDEEDKAAKNCPPEQQQFCGNQSPENWPIQLQPASTPTTSEVKP